MTFPKTKVNNLKTLNKLILSRRASEFVAKWIEKELGGCSFPGKLIQEFAGLNVPQDDGINGLIIFSNIYFTEETIDLMNEIKYWPYCAFVGCTLTKGFRFIREYYFLSINEISDETLVSNTREASKLTFSVNPENTNQIMVGLENAVKLEYLKMIGHHQVLSDELPACISRMTTLKKLTWSHLFLKDSPNLRQALTSVENVSFIKCALTRDILNSLAHCSSVAFLDCTAVPEIERVPLWDTMQCISLRLDMRLFTSDSAAFRVLKRIASNRYIKRLSLLHCKVRLITNLCRAISSMQFITELELGFCTTRADLQSLAEALRRCALLEKVTLTNCWPVPKLESFAQTLQLGDVRLESSRSSEE